MPNSNPHHNARKNVEELESHLVKIKDQLPVEVYILLASFRDYIRGEAARDVVPPIYKKAIDTYGLESQLGLLQEECAELIQAVSKYRRGRNHNISEEIADVSIMTEQIIHSMDLKAEVEAIKAEKLERLQIRMG